MGWGRVPTHRQFMLLEAWERETWNLPDRTDHYLMWLIHETRYAFRKMPDRLDLGAYRIPFGMAEETRNPNGEEPDLTVEQAAARSKARWAGRGFSPGPPKGNPVVGEGKRVATSGNPFYPRPE